MNFTIALGIVGLLVGGVACMAGHWLTGLLNVLLGLILLDIGGANSE